MTPDQLTALDRKAAEKIMGFTRLETTYLTPEEIHWSDWSPSTNIFQSFELLNKISGDYKLKKTNNKFSVVIFYHSKNGSAEVMEQEEDTLELAITLACLRSVGEIDE